MAVENPEPQLQRASDERMDRVGAHSAVDHRLRMLYAGLVGIGHSTDEIVPESRFIEDLGFDSLDCVELTMAVEEAPGISTLESNSRTPSSMRSGAYLCPRMS